MGIRRKPGDAPASSGESKIQNIRNRGRTDQAGVARPIRYFIQPYKSGGLGILPYRGETATLAGPFA